MKGNCQPTTSSLFFLILLGQISLIPFPEFVIDRVTFAN